MSDVPIHPDPSAPSPDLPPPPAKPKRRPRYSGKNPRRFDQKYKEHRPDLYPETVQKVLASGKTPAGMHRPVMLTEVLEFLKPQPGEVGVDCTLGYGGHAKELWMRCQPGGHLLAFDVDPRELQRTEARLREELNPGESLLIQPGNFAGVAKVLANRGMDGVDFLLADLGVSSMQLDDPARGFSYKANGPLDLRMNPAKGPSAAAFLKSVTEKELSQVLAENADEPRAAIIARGLVSRRAQRPIETTLDLTQALQEALGVFPGRLRDDEFKSTCQRVFQALRIHVNGEFTALDALLRSLPQVLNHGGRVVILSFHSGEDRRVKHAFQQGWKAGLYSHISQEVVRPTAEERHSNPRASCVKLRWAVRSPRETATMPLPGTSTAAPEHPLLTFRSSGIHGTGAFAKVAIPQGTRLIEYLGERIDKAESFRRCLRQNEYIFTLDDDSDLDGDVPWNPARLLNHSCDPNCEALNEEGHIWIHTIRPIAPEEEVTFNYGFDMDRFREHPCRCGSAKCVGYMVAEEYHDEVRRLVAQKPKQ